MSPRVGTKQGPEAFTMHESEKENCFGAWRVPASKG